MFFISFAVQVYCRCVSSKHLVQVLLGACRFAALEEYMACSDVQIKKTKREAKQTKDLAARKKKRERKKWYVVTRGQEGSEHARGQRPFDTDFKVIVRNESFCVSKT